MKPDDRNFEEWLRRYADSLMPVVPFTPGDKLLQMDFTAANAELTDEVLADTNSFIRYVNKKLSEADAKYGVGGYGEDRIIYKRSRVFDAQPNDTSPVSDTTHKVESSQSGPRSEAPVAFLSGRSGWAALPQSGTPQPVEDSEQVNRGFGYHWADHSLYGMLQEYAQRNRAHPTHAESVLWKAIKAKKLGSYKFRRQFIIHKYIADLVCLDKRLVIEVDGSIHQLPENKASDETRTIELNKKGFAVLRFTNDEVLHNQEATLQTILDVLGSSPSIREDAMATSLLVSEEQKAEPRSVHLGLDIWGPPYTKVFAPLNGIVHSFAFNNAFGDYGATIILTHNLDGITFHTLYGHLSLNSIKNIQEGDAVMKGDVIAEFGIPFENGQWPPHLHFQIIKDMQGMKGDYPGVCAPSERDFYLNNCPDADIIAGMMQHAKPQ